MTWALTQYVLALGIQILYAPSCLGSLLKAQHVSPGAAQQSPSVRLLTSMGGRKLQQHTSLAPFSVHSLPVPASRANSTTTVASPPTAVIAVPLSTPADLPDPELAPSPFEVSYPIAAPPLSADSPEQTWSTILLPTSSLVPESVSDPTEAPLRASSMPGGVHSHGSLAPEESIWMDDGATASTTKTSVVLPPVLSAEEPSEQPAVLSNATAPMEAPPPSLVTSVFGNQIHQGHLRISVVVITAGLMVFCGLGACLLFVAKRWYAEPEEDDYPLSPRGSYFILKTRPGAQGPLINHHNAMRLKSNESMQGYTLKSLLKKSLHNTISIPASSAGGSARRTSNWGSGGIPATQGFSHTLPSAADALFSSNWGWNTGGRELGNSGGNQLYHSTTDTDTQGEEDPNASTWPPASRMNRILSVLLDGAEEDERAVSTLFRSSQLVSFRNSPLPCSTATIVTDASLCARRSSDPFPVHFTQDHSSATPRDSGDSHAVLEHEGSQGLVTAGTDRSATACGRATGSTGHSNSGQGAAPALARICELGRMASSEMTVLVDASVGEGGDHGDGHLRYTGSHHQNKHSPVNQGPSGATWRDRRSSCASKHQSGGTEQAARDTVSRLGSAAEVEDLSSHEDSWHSMHSAKSARSSCVSASDRTDSGQARVMLATVVGGAADAVQRQGSSGVDTASKITVSPQDPRQRMHAKRRLQLAQNAADPAVTPHGDAIFDRLFSDPAPAVPLDLAAASSRHLEALNSLGGTGSGVSGASASGPQYHTQECFSHLPEPSVEPSRMQGKRPSSARSSRTPHRDHSRAILAGGTMYGMPSLTYARNTSASVSGGIHDAQQHRSQLYTQRRSSSSQREQAAPGHAADRTDSAGTQSSWETEAIAKQAAAAWRSGRRGPDGASSQVRNTSSVVHIEGHGGSGTARKLGHDRSGRSQHQSGKTLCHSSSMAASVDIRGSLALQHKRVVQASRDPLCFSTRPRRRSHVGNSHTASALRNVIASTNTAAEDAPPHLATTPRQNRSISPRFRHTVAATSNQNMPTTAPFPFVPVSDYALTWLSKVRLSQGDAVAKPPPTQRITDTASARGLEELAERDQDSFTGQSSSIGSAGGASAKGSKRLLGSTQTARCSSHAQAKAVAQPDAFGSAHIPHANISPDGRMQRTASFGCQVEPQMMAGETRTNLSSLGIAVGRSVAGSVASTSVLGSSAAPSPMEPYSHPLRGTLSSHSSQPPPPPPAPSNASNMHAPNACVERSSAAMSPSGAANLLQRSQSDTRAPWPSILKSLSGAQSSAPGQGNNSTVYSSVRSDTLPTDEDVDTIKQSSLSSQADVRSGGGALLCAVCCTGLHAVAGADRSVTHNSSGSQNVQVQGQCENCGTAIDAEQEGDGADQERLRMNADCSDELPLLSASALHGGVLDSQNGIGGSAKSVVQASMDSVRTSYGFVALGALAERCLRSSGGSIRGSRMSHRALQKVTHSTDGSTSDSHMHAQRASLSRSEDCSISIGNPNNSVATSAAARAEVVQGSLELPKRSTSVQSTSLTFALPASHSGTSDAPTASRLVAAAPSIELITTAMQSHSDAVHTADLVPSWGTGHSSTDEAPHAGTQDADAIRRSAPCLSLQLLSPSPSPEAMLGHECTNDKELTHGAAPDDPCATHPCS